MDPSAPEQDSVRFVVDGNPPPTYEASVDPNAKPNSSEGTTMVASSTVVPGSDEPATVPLDAIVLEKPKPIEPDRPWTTPQCLSDLVFPFLLAVFFSALFLAIFLGVTWKQDIQYVTPWAPTWCAYTSYVNSTRCCDRVNCQCQECYAPIGCAQAMYQKVDGPCCDAPSCCREEYDTCYRQVYSSCCTRDSDHHCQSCTRTESYRCNLHCVLAVQSQTCQVACGQCATITSHYIYTTPTTGERHDVHVNTCGRGDAACVASYVALYTGNTTCWYLRDEPLNGAVSAFPHHDLNVAAIFFSVVFGLCAVVGLCETVYVLGAWCRQELAARSHFFTDAWCCGSSSKAP